MSPGFFLLRAIGLFCCYLKWWKKVLFIDKKLQSTGRHKYKSVKSKNKGGGATF